MRRGLCIVIVALMLFGTVAVSAKEAEGTELEKVVSVVKDKAGVDKVIDDSLKEMEVNKVTSKYGSNRYYIKWSDRFDYEYVEVLCDEDARILSYMHYGEEGTRDRANTISYSEAAEFADDFLHKLAPELFENKEDCLERNDESDLEDQRMFSIKYDRVFNGIKVEDNSAFVDVCSSDSGLCVTYANINYDYDAKFDKSGETIENFNDAYLKAFPLELVYKEINRSYINKNDYKIKTALVYRFKDDECGYILASDGSVVEKDVDDSFFNSENSAISEGKQESLDAASGGAGNVLSDKEINEIKTVEGLIEADKAVEILAQTPEIVIENDMTLTYSYVKKINDSDYAIFLELSNQSDEEYKYANASFDAKTGKLMSFRCSYEYDNKKVISDAEKQSANKAVDSFLKYVLADEAVNLTESSVVAEKNLISKRYDKKVNDIRYVNDGVDIRYDVSAGRIVSYTRDIEENTDFDEAESVIKAEKAKDTMLEINPIELKYVKVNGAYTKCYTVNDKFAEIDGFSGERFNAEDKNLKKIEYADIEGHWAEEAIKGLADSGIVLYNTDESDNNFYPDTGISQEEFLRLSASSLWYTDYLNYDVFKLYNRMMRNEIIEKKDISAVSMIKRGDAFKYLIRMDGLENVASLSGIYTVDYEDFAEIKSGEEGYAAILAGMGVLKGDNGYIRPNDYMTRAEAVALLYNYINKQSV